MSYSGNGSVELDDIETRYSDVYDESLPLIAPIRSSWQSKMAQRAHVNRPKPTPPKERVVILPFPRGVSGFEDRQAERETRAIRTERSRDQLLDVLHGMAQIALEESKDTPSIPLS